MISLYILRVYTRHLLYCSSPGDVEGITRPSSLSTLGGRDPLSGRQGDHRVRDGMGVVFVLIQKCGK